MFICKNRGEEKREECRVEGEVYLRAARADKIIRQKTPGVDDGEARGGSGLQTGRSERRRKERRGNERWRDRPVRPGRMGKESCIADVVDAAAHESEEGGEGCRGDQKRRKPDRNARTNASCYGLPDRDAYLARE